MTDPAQVVCCRCGRRWSETFLHRVNKTGVTGVWLCDYHYHLTEPHVIAAVIHRMDRLGQGDEIEDNENTDIA